MAGRTAIRPLVVSLPLEDLDRLRAIGAARRGRPEPAELVAHLVRTWLDGPGQGELLAALTRWAKGGKSTPPQGQMRGQMDLLEACDHSAATGP